MDERVGKGKGIGIGAGDGSGDGDGRCNGTDWGWGSGWGSGWGWGSGDGDGYSYRFDLERSGDSVKIGCQTLTIEEWLGERGRELADEHGISELEQVFLRAQLEVWRDE